MAFPRDGDWRRRRHALSLDQSYVANTAAILVISAFLHRSMHKYLDRGYRDVLLETGHVAQNLDAPEGSRYKRVIV